MVYRGRMSGPAPLSVGLVAWFDESAARGPLPTTPRLVDDTDFLVRTLDVLRACGLRYRDGGRWRLFATAARLDLG